MEQGVQVVVDEVRWQAVVAREISANEGFVYAVRSTGIYCRLLIAAASAQQRPLFSASDAAERAGFRPCLRCRPTRAQQIPRRW